MRLNSQGLFMDTHKLFTNFLKLKKDKNISNKLLHFIIFSSFINVRYFDNYKSIYINDLLVANIDNNSFYSSTNFNDRYTLFSFLKHT